MAGGRQERPPGPLHLPGFPVSDVTQRWYRGAGAPVNDGRVRELREVKPVEAVDLPSRDVRAGRVGLSRESCASTSCARACGSSRSPSLDVARHVPRDLDGAGDQGVDPLGPDRRARHHVRPDARVRAARMPGDAAAVRPLGPLPRPRPAARLRDADRLAVPGDARDPRLRRDRGPRVQLVLHLLRLAVLRGRLRLGLPRRRRMAQRGPAARCRLPPPRRARRRRIAHRRCRPRAARQHRDPAVRARLADAAHERRPARLRLARPARAQLRRGRRGADRRPRVPAGPGARPDRPLPPQQPAHPRRAVDDGDPDGPGRVRARASRYRCSRSSSRSSTASTSSSSAASTWSAR